MRIYPFFLQVITILLKRDNSMMDTKNQKNYKESKSFTPFLMDAGSDAILLGAETLRGLYPVETISIVGKICSEVCLFLKLLIFLNVSFKLANRNWKIIELVRFRMVENDRVQIKPKYQTSLATPVHKYYIFTICFC